MKRSSRGNVTVSTTRPSKDAILFLVDTSPSMDHAFEPAVEDSTLHPLNSEPESGLTQESQRPQQSQRPQRQTRQPQRQTRLSKSKQMVEDLIVESMNRSKTSEVGVLLLNTEKTHHHLFTNHDVDDDDDDDDDDDETDDGHDHHHDYESHAKDKKLKNTKSTNNTKNDNDNDNDNVNFPLFEHITELVPLQRPTVDTLRKIRSISISTKSTKTTRKTKSSKQDGQVGNGNGGGVGGGSDGGSGGGFIAGLCIAVDILHTMTSTKTYNRKIVLFTDAEQKLQMYGGEGSKRECKLERRHEENNMFTQIELALHSMREMNCELIIHGLDFDSWSDVCFDAPKVTKVIKEVPISSSSTSDMDMDMDTNEDERGFSGEREDLNHIHNHNHGYDCDEEQMKNIDDSTIKAQNEKLLMSLLKHTTGEIHPIICNDKTASASHSASASASHKEKQYQQRRRRCCRRHQSKQYKTSTLYKTILNIGPITPNDLFSIPVRVSTYTMKRNIPSLKREAVIFESGGSSTTDNINDNDDDDDDDDDDESNNIHGHLYDSQIQIQATNNQIQTRQKGAVATTRAIKKDILGNDMTTPIISSTSHWDIDDPEIEVDMQHRTNGYMYGSDVIPINQFDLEGLKYRASASRSSKSTSKLFTSTSSSSSALPSINILGYASSDVIPIKYWMGPIKMISGDTNNSFSYQDTCKLISSIAQALHQRDKVAVCTYISSRNGDPVMSILTPFIEKEQGDVHEAPSPSPPRYLLLVQIPFADDVQNMNMNSFEDAIGNDDAIQVCDEFIDRFMLPSNTLQSEYIPNPGIRSFHKTVINRAIDPSDKERIIIPREQENCGAAAAAYDAMSTPHDLLEEGKDILKRFREMFPLEVVENDDGDKSRRKPKKRFWNNLD